MPGIPRSRKTALLVALVAIVIPSALFARGCSSTYPNRNPTGEPFPAVAGNSLEKERAELPAAFAGAPAIVIVGYRQRAQFDIDRWVMGLLQADVDAEIVELPTIPGLTASFASGWIDDGMRSGIPEEEWGAVITLYGDAAAPVAKLTGTEDGQLARVLVLDPDGVIVWFDDKGYSPRKAIEVADLLAQSQDQ